MKTANLYLVLVSLLALLVSNAFAATWTGSTSEPENTRKIDGKTFYVITTADELAWFANQVNGGQSTINAVLGNNIVFGKDNSTRCSVKWTPIGKDPSHKFAGILDGAGYTIYGIYVDGIPVAGIVGVLGTGGIVRNLRTNSGYIGGSFRVGGFVAHNDGTIQSAENNNKIEGSYKSGDTTSIYVGGIAGHNNGTITTSSNKMPVSNKAPTALSGGIAGKNSGQIVNSGNSGSVSAIIYKTGARYEAGTSDGIYSGGIVGHNIGSINKIKNIGSVTADGHIVYYKDLCVGCNMEQSHDVYRKTYSGGIVGLSSTTISNGINTGKITNSNKENRFINGIVASGNAKNSIDLQSLKYWLNEAETQGTAENMQKDQFAWILNTTNGTEANSGMWTRTTDYPGFANETNLPIYKVVFNDDGATSNRYTNYQGIVSFPNNPEPADGFVFMGWYNADNEKVRPTTVFSADQTVNAVYANENDVYWTIRFFNSDANQTLLESKQYQHGSAVSYNGETPTRETTIQYIYTFKSWDVEPTNAVDDYDYHAVYDSTLRSYTITFYDYNDEVIESAAFEYGETPACSKTLSRTSTAEWEYTHKGWTPAIDVVVGIASYKARYDSSKVKYKVTFMNGTTVIEEQMIPYGSSAVAPTNVTREGYRFIGWNTSFSTITGPLTVVALFEEITMFIVSVVTDDGGSIANTQIEEGNTYTLPTPPTKTGYTFDAYYDGETRLGVSGDIISIASDIVITAKYTKNPESSSSSMPRSSSSSAIRSSSSKTISSSSNNTVAEVVVVGKLEQTVCANCSIETIVFKNVQSYSRKSWTMPFIEIKKTGSDLTVTGTVPDYYKYLEHNGEKIKDSLTINGQIYRISFTIQNEEIVYSSSSGSAMPVPATITTQFSLKAFDRNLQVLGAKIGSAYAIFDMQGRVLKKGRVESASFIIPMNMAGNYLVQVGNRTQRITIK